MFVMFFTNQILLLVSMVYEVGIFDFTNFPALVEINYRYYIPFDKNIGVTEITMANIIFVQPVKSFPVLR